MEDEDINIDDEWILEFNEEERNYGQLYKEPNTYVSLQMIYVNSKKEIEHVCQSYHKLNDSNVLQRNTLKDVILERNHINSTCFRLYKLLLYNISTDPEEIITKSKPFQELREITEIKDIVFDDTINYFKPLNTLYFIFVEDIRIPDKQAAKPFSLNKGVKT